MLNKIQIKFKSLFLLVLNVGVWISIGLVYLIHLFAKQSSLTPLLCVLVKLLCYVLIYFPECPLV